MITVKSFTYIPSSPGTLKQGVKNHHVPRGAVGGSNGSFIMMGQPPAILLGYEEDGIKQCANIYYFVKEQSNRRVTEKYSSKICTPLIGQIFADWNAVRQAIFKNL